MNHEGNRHPLEITLSEQLDCSQQLLACLSSERNALLGRDTQALQNITREKLDCTRRLDMLEEQRDQAVRALGFRNTIEDIPRCLASLPGARRLGALWRQLIENMEACRAANLANGAILEANRQQAEMALGILRGETATPAVYAADGDARAQFGQRELGKA
ncbi:MAG TPA: flagellar protein FlgN [Gammaproteobacteria bacterium]|nr:flagellar protein FlgN [Gammaproteobacteria bacterium]